MTTTTRATGARSLRRLTGLASLALAGALLAGCGTNASASDEASADPAEYTTPRTMPEGMGSGESDGTFPRTVSHFQGDTTLEEEPERVVVISTGQADGLLTLGVVPVGSTSGDGADMVPEYQFEAFPEDRDALESMEYVGNRSEPDLEAIANTDPDLILMNNAGKDAEGLYSKLTEIAPTVSTQGTGLYWKQDFLLMADAVGKVEQAQEWLDAYHADTAAYADGLAESPTVSFLRKNGDRTRVYGVASFPGSVAEDSGLARPESQTFTDELSIDISAEQLDQADADWLFYGVQGEASELTDAALWPTLEAVSNDQAVQVDDDAFYLNAGPTAARLMFDTLQENIGS